MRLRLASQSATIFGARLAGAGIVFLAQAGIARIWGAGILGEYLLVIAAVNLIAVFMPLGFHTVASYFAAEYRARGDRDLLVAFLVRAYGHIGLIALALVVIGPPLMGMFGDPGRIVVSHWLPTCILAVSTALVFVNGAVLVGLKRPLAGFFADTLFRPMAMIAALAVGVGASTAAEGFERMLWIVSLGYLAVAVLHFGFVLGTTRAVPRAVAPALPEIRRWWRFAAPWTLISLATDFFFDIDLLLLAGHLNREELAIFGVCTRVFSLVSFGVGAVYAVTLPDMFESEAMKDRAGFNRKIGDANLVAAGLSVVLLLLVLIGGPLVLTLFGPAFLAGTVPLAILCVALVVRSAFGPASLVLSIHDRPYASLPSIALGMMALLGGNLLLIPPFGLVGAALAALLAITLWSLALWVTAYRTAGIDVSIASRLRIAGEERALATARGSKL